MITLCLLWAVLAQDYYQEEMFVRFEPPNPYDIEEVDAIAGGKTPSGSIVVTSSSVTREGNRFVIDVGMDGPQVGTTDIGRYMVRHSLGKIAAGSYETVQKINCREANPVTLSVRTTPERVRKALDGTAPLDPILTDLASDDTEKQGAAEGEIGLLGRLRPEVLHGSLPGAIEAERDPARKQRLAAVLSHVTPVRLTLKVSGERVITTLTNISSSEIRMPAYVSKNGHSASYNWRLQVGPVFNDRYCPKSDASETLLRPGESMEFSTDVAPCLAKIRERCKEYIQGSLPDTGIAYLSCGPEGAEPASVRVEVPIGQ